MTLFEVFYLDDDMQLDYNSNAISYVVYWQLGRPFRIRITIRGRISFHSRREVSEPARFRVLFLVTYTLLFSITSRDVTYPTQRSQ